MASTSTVSLGRFWETEGFHVDSTKNLEIDARTDVELDMEDYPQQKRRKDDDFVELEERTYPQPHPLLIDHIILKILDYSPDFIKTVQTFRLVCKQWNDLATKSFRNARGRVRFEDDFHRNTSSFIETMQNSWNPPFDKFKFRGGFVLFKPYGNSYQFDEVYDALFRSCSPWMKSFEFASHNPSDMQFPKSVKSQDLSRLNSLSFHVCVFYSNLQFGMTDYLGSLLEAAENLAALDIRLVTTDPSIHSEAQLALMNVFGNIISRKLPRSCKNLRLNMLLNDSHFRTLEQRSLRLKTLAIDFQKVLIRPEIFRLFLASQAETLEELDLIQSSFSPEGELVFPVMKRLALLRIEGRPALPNFQFPVVFPNLKTFEVLFYWIYQDEAGWLKRVLEENGKAVSVQELEFHCDIGKEEEFMISRFVATFPNLHKLTLVIGAGSVLTLVFRLFQQLEELDLTLSREFWDEDEEDSMGKVDEVFVGFPADLCVQLWEKNDFENAGVPETLGGWSIRNMKRLTKLTVRAYRAEQIPLTDVTVHFGFLKIQNLNKLTLDSFPVSKPCLKLLEKRVKLHLLPGPPTLP